MTYKLPPHKIVSEWAEKNFVRFVSRSHGLATTETISKSSLDDLVAYAIAAIEAQGVPDKTGTAYADLHAKWRKGRQELANLTRAHERLKAQGVPDVDDLRDRLVAISSAVAEQNDRLAQALIGDTLAMLASAPPAPRADKYVPCPYCGKNTASDNPSQWCPCPKRASVVQQEPVADIKISGDDFDLGLTDAFAFGRLRLPDGHHLLYTHPAQQAKPKPITEQELKAERRP